MQGRRYTYGMTMKRNEKSQAARELTEGARFASPKLRAAAIADRGHDRMTAAEYREHRLGRGRMATCRLDLVIEDRARALRQAARKVTRR
jgi:hypothetical protein